MESILGAGDCDSRRAVIRSGITLAEVVGLDRSIVGADLLLFSSVSLNLNTSNKVFLLSTYPVNLIEIIRLHHSSTNNTSAIGGSHLDINSTEEDIKVSLDSRGISLLGNREFCAKRSALDSACRGVPFAERRRTRSEIGIELPLAQAGVGRAGF